MTLSDVELIERTLAGDETAFGFLVDKYKGAVHALAYRKLGDFQLAEEIAQDTFLAAYQKLGTLRNHTHLPGWLYVIASRRCLMWQRKNRPRVQSIGEMKTGEMDSIAQRRHAEKQTQQQVRDALESLPESERTVLTLHYFGGLTGKEIAQFIGTSPGAVLNRLYRARARLKEEIIPMIRATSGMIQLPPTFTQQLIRQIRELQPTPSPSGKPWVPWIAATTVFVIALFIGIGQQRMTSFQRPYSLDAPESEIMVEILDMPVVEPLPAERPLFIHGVPSIAGKTGTGDRSNDAVLGKAVEPPARAKSAYAEWTPMNGPYGGTILSLLATPEGTLFAGTDYALLFRSPDGGQSWKKVHTPLEDLPHLRWLTSLAAIDDTLYATGSFVVSSTDGGDSWTRDVRFGEDRDGFCGVAIIKGTLYAGSRERGVLRSNDDGQTWVPMNEGLTDSPDSQSENVPGIGIIPEPMINTFLAEGATLYVGSDAGAFRRKAGADRWEPLHKAMFTDVRTGLELPKNPAQPFSSVRSLATKGGEIYLATREALYRSSTGGSSWKQIPWKNELYRGSIMSIAAAGDMVYAGVYSSGVFRSTDNGQTWKSASAGIASSTVQDVEGLNGAVYATDRFSVSRSSDRGISWETIHKGLPPDSYIERLVVSTGTLYAAVGSLAGQIYRWDESRASWLRVASDTRLIGVSSLTIQGKIFCVGTNHDGVFRSPDGGGIWTELGLRGKKINAIAVRGMDIYAGTEGEGIFRLEHGSGTWQQLDVSSTIHRVRDLVVADGTLYAAGITTRGPLVRRLLCDVGNYAIRGVLRSHDGGDSWKMVNGGLKAGMGVTSLAVDQSTLYTSDGLRIFRLPLGADSWEPVSSGLTRDPLHVQCLGVDGAAVYAGTFGFGVFQVSLDAELEKP